MNSIRTLFVLGAGVGFASLAAANFVVTSRESQFSWDYLYGYGPDVYTDNGASSLGTLLDADSMTYTDHVEDSGAYLGHSWEVDFDWNTQNSYSVTGSLNDASLIQTSGSTMTDAMTGGASLGVGANSQVTIYFTVGSETDYHLFGSLNHVGPRNRNNSTLYLQGDFGFGYQTIFVREADTVIDTTGTLAAANYRLIAYAGSRADVMEATYANWDINLQAVPEPMTMAVLIPGLIALCRRRQKLS